MHCTHAMFGGRCFHDFVLIAIGKLEILALFPHFQNEKEVIRRYEGWHCTRLESYCIIFHFETDWSRIHLLPSTILKEEQRKVLCRFVGSEDVFAVLPTGYSKSPCYHLSLIVSELMDCSLSFLLSAIW